MFRRRRSLQSISAPGAPDLVNPGDQQREAFAALYARFADRVHAYVLQRLRDPDLAADITGTVFTRALGNLHSFEHRDDTALEGWLLTIARNAIIDHVRTDRHLTTLDTDTYRQQVTSTSPDPASAPVAPDERERLLAALQRLNPVQQRIVLLRLQGWNGIEIAELLEMSHSAVRVAQHRAYARLRELITADSLASRPDPPESDHA